MIINYPYKEIGSAEFGWLHAHYHFSFSNYYNPKRLGFGKIKVINDDVIEPHQGFATHSHSDMEIITYVKTGVITHTDSLGNTGKTIAGDVQVMSAGSGISHSEYNLEDEATTLYQIWIEPKEYGITPRWKSAEFPKNYADNTLSLLVSGDGNAPLTINQDARIYAGKIKAGQRLHHAIQAQAYILASTGSFKINDTLLRKGDGAEVVGETSVMIEAITECELLIIEV